MPRSPGLLAFWHALRCGGPVVTTHACQAAGSPWACHAEAGHRGRHSAPLYPLAPEHLAGNHSQRPHNDRIAPGLDEPGLRAHLLLHDVRMMIPGVIGHSRVLV